METKQQVRVRKLIKELRQWGATPHPHLNEGAKDGIRKALAQKNSRAAAAAAGQLGFLAVWHAEHGSLSIIDGKVEGWAQMDRALYYLWAEARLDHGMLLVSSVAARAAHAIVFDEETIAEELVSRLISSLTDRKLLGCWEFSAFGAFLLVLWGLYRGTGIDVARPGVAPLGVYQRILDAWNDERALGTALAAALDYHLEQTRETPEYPEFIDPPYLLFPVDFLVVEKIRWKLGLPTPPVDHPLLDTPLAKVPPPEERPRMGPDPLLDEVMARAYADGLLVRPGAAPMTAEEVVDKVVREMRERHADRASNDLRNQAVQRLRSAVVGKRSHSGQRAAAQLGPLADWHGRQGVLAILDGRIDGWADIERAFFYRAWQARICSIEVSSAALALANALVFEEGTMAECLGTRLMASLKDWTIGRGWEQSSFGVFMMKLWSLLVGRDVDAPCPEVKLASLGAYEGILTAWHDDAALYRALQSACDYHVEQTRYRSPSPEFVHTPYELFPVDILAIGAVRRKLGLLMPAVEHPLLATSLARVPPAQTRPRMGSDPLLDDVIVRAKHDGFIR